MLIKWVFSSQWHFAEFVDSPLIDPSDCFDLYHPNELIRSTVHINYTSNWPLQRWCIVVSDVHKLVQLFGVNLLVFAVEKLFQKLITAYANTPSPSVALGPRTTLNPSFFPIALRRPSSVRGDSMVSSCVCFPVAGLAA